MKYLHLLTTAACLLPMAISHALPRDSEATFPEGWGYCKHFPEKGSIKVSSFTPETDLRPIAQDDGEIRELKFTIQGDSDFDLEDGATVEGEAKKVGKKKLPLCGGEGSQRCPSRELEFTYSASFPKGKKTKKSQRRVTVKVRNGKGDVLTCVEGKMDLWAEGEGE
ncbi:hypothetical protein M409DRAFT_55624 [Zasmidium cellare ATCC 36951]|uniref:Phosphatidylglycerol/phosphatidylinositol transfer protein n=1 Tax=Zasmidium cellare ATCC 36951 TaxID=1080233 RepID=A0A6A6CHT5_ZASCE|nr:uncharacterized protein M409DRAFT_55624 [Zasmidium cellare ATCC 36951]KAF2165748.1 hypothetical protein M409DRAFT_55624 [Zasmidium cellare ATCC 36951]